MTQDSAAAKTSTLLQALWQRNLPILRSRLALLESAADSAVAGSLSDELRSEAGATAHKLAGSLGMFGYTGGTEICRSIEHLLEGSEPFAPETLRQMTASLRMTLRID